MGKTEKSAGSVSIIGGSDGPTSVFLLGGGKKTLKQRVHKTVFNLRKKWHALWIKPCGHTMEEVVAYIKENYGFVELTADSREYQSEYRGMRASFIMQYAPELLGEYAEHPQLTGRDEESVREFQRQIELRQQRAMEVSENEFTIDLHVLHKKEKKSEMHLSLESRFGYIGGGFSGQGKHGQRRFRKIYRDIHRYYGVTETDIAEETQRYKELLTTLAMK